LTQYHYLDESGDPGPKSNRYFASALVQLAGHTPLPELAAVRQTLHLSPVFEFKYHATTLVQKELFFRSIQPLAFRVRAAAVDKTRLAPPLAALSGMDFIVEWTTRLILRASELDIANDVLVMDGAVPSLRRAMRIRLSAECHQSGRERPFSKIISADSSRDDNLQLADMIVGAVRQHMAMGESQYYATFARKVVDLWEAP
jgi:hypothetical protein